MTDSSNPTDPTNPDPKSSAPHEVAARLIRTHADAERARADEEREKREQALGGILARIVKANLDLDAIAALNSLMDNDFTLQVPDSVVTASNDELRRQVQTLDAEKQSAETRATLAEQAATEATRQAEEMRAALDGANRYAAQAEAWIHQFQMPNGANFGAIADEVFHAKLGIAPGDVETVQTWLAHLRNGGGVILPKDNGVNIIEKGKQKLQEEADQARAAQDGNPPTSPPLQPASPDPTQVPPPKKGWRSKLSGPLNGSTETPAQTTS